MTLFFSDISIYTRPTELLDGFKDFHFQSGDYCLLKCGETLYKFIAITKPLNIAKKWEDYPVLDSFHVAGVSFKAKFILFSYDASSGRRGNIKDLSKLKEFLHVSEIKDLIKNSIEILYYKTDRWDANILVSIIQLTNNLNKKKAKVGHSKKQVSDFSNIPFFTVVKGDAPPWLTLKRFENLNITKQSPVSYLFRTSFIDNEVFSFCSSNGLVYLLDIIDTYNKYANFSSLEGDSLAIEESLKMILLYASHKGWTELYTGNEDKSVFLAKRKNEDSCVNVHKKESNSIAEVQKEFADKLKIERDKKRKLNKSNNDNSVEKKKTTISQTEIINEKDSNSIEESVEQKKEKNSDPIEKTLEKNIDTVFINFDYLVRKNIIDEDTYDCLKNNKCRIFRHLLIEFKKDPSLKNWKHLSANVWKYITRLTQYAIKKKWITNTGND